jgi:AbrB family looped-hinge helix DNA binding protein
MSDIKMVKLGKKGQIVIPKVLRDKIGIGTGDLLLITAEGDRISIIPPEKYAKMTRGLLKGLWGNTPDEVKAYIEMERKSWE